MDGRDREENDDDRELAGRGVDWPGPLSGADGGGVGREFAISVWEDTPPFSVSDVFDCAQVDETRGGD